MSGDPSLNPYSASSNAEVSYAPSGVPARSGWLVAVCVICIVLGAMGTMNGLMGMVSVAFQKQIQQMFPAGPQPGVPAEMAEAQEKLNQQTQELQSQFAIPLGVAAAARVGVGLALAIGGIWCLTRKSGGHRVLVGALAAVLLFEVASAILQIVLTTRMMALMGEFFQKMVDTMPNQANGPPPELMLNVMRGAMWVGFVIGMLWQVVKMCFYLFSLLYLRRPAVAAQCEPVA